MRFIAADSYQDVLLVEAQSFIKVSPVSMAEVRPYASTYDFVIAATVDFNDR
jgi:hypothetical protein